MKPHKKHAYQIMANELKMPHLMVSGIYMGLQVVCCTIYIVAWISGILWNFWNIGADVSGVHEEVLSFACRESLISGGVFIGDGYN